MIAERLAVIERLVLGRGGHKTPSGPTPTEACLMEAVSFVAGEAWSDHPECACPVLSAFMRSWNDGLDDADRNRLLRPLIPRLIGTRSTPAVETRRACMALDWYLREITPAFLALVPALKPHADIIAAAAEVKDRHSANSIRSSVIACRDAAWAAAWDAAGDAAVDAAGAALRPTVEKLQSAALLLVERMMAVQP